MGFLSWLNPLNSIIGAAERAHQRVLDAKNNTERLEAEKDRDYWRARLEAVNAAAQHDKWWSPRNIMGWSVAAFVVKIVLWDSTIMTGWNGVTPNPGSLVTWIVLTIIGFYFLSRSADRITDTIASAMARKGGR